VTSAACRSPPAALTERGRSRGCSVCMTGMREGEDAACDTTSGGAGSPEEVPAPTAAAVRSCAHDAWAPLLREHTYRSESIDLPQARRGGGAAAAALRVQLLLTHAATHAAQDFVAYLLADGVHLRANSNAARARLRARRAARLYASSQKRTSNCRARRQAHCARLRPASCRHAPLLTHWTRTTARSPPTTS
jgi:hypothetical protein